MAIRLFGFSIGRAATASSARQTRVPSHIKAVTNALRQRRKGNAFREYSASLKKFAAGPKVQARPAIRLTPPSTCGVAPPPSLPLRPPRYIVRSVLPLKPDQAVSKIVADALSAAPGLKISLSEPKAPPADGSRVVQLSIVDAAGITKPLGEVIFEYRDPRKKQAPINIISSPVTTALKGATFTVTVPGTPVYGRLQCTSAQNQGRDRQNAEPGA